MTRETAWFFTRIFIAVNILVVIIVSIIDNRNGRLSERLIAWFVAVFLPSLATCLFLHYEVWRQIQIKNPKR